MCFVCQMASHLSSPGYFWRRVNQNTQRPNRRGSYPPRTEVFKEEPNGCVIVGRGAAISTWLVFVISDDILSLFYDLEQYMCYAKRCCYYLLFLVNVIAIHPLLMGERRCEKSHFELTLPASVWGYLDCGPPLANLQPFRESLPWLVQGLRIICQSKWCTNTTPPNRGREQRGSVVWMLVCFRNQGLFCSFLPSNSF